jgi:hypothetical protein
MLIMIPDVKYFEERHHNMLLTLLHLSVLTVPTATLQLVIDVDGDPLCNVT